MIHSPNTLLVYVCWRLHTHGLDWGEAWLVSSNRKVWCLFGQQCRFGREDEILRFLGFPPLCKYKKSQIKKHNLTNTIFKTTFPGQSQVKQWHSFSPTRKWEGESVLRHTHLRLQPWFLAKGTLSTLQCHSLCYICARWVCISFHTLQLLQNYFQTISLHFWQMQN